MKLPYFAIGILRIFGITIFSFMTAGGVLLFIVAIELLTEYGDLEAVLSLVSQEWFLLLSLYSQDLVQSLL